jgi:hypothetical protein
VSGAVLLVLHDRRGRRRNRRQMRRDLVAAVTDHDGGSVRMQGRGGGQCVAQQ